MIATAQKVHCRECDEWKELPLSETEAMKFMALQLCRECHFWHCLDLLKEDPNSVRINGKHYWIGAETSLEEDPPRWRGMGGGRVIVRFKDGREVVSTNFWYNGVIPQRWVDRLPDNAVFVRQL